MPLYDCKCTVCGHEFEYFCKIAEMKDIDCIKCGKRAKTLITCDKRDWFREHYNEHFTGEPILVKSKRHLKELCLKYDVTSRALGDVRNITEI